MLKAEREIQNHLRLIDIVLELIDARAPASTTNPRLREMIKNQRHITVLSKCDLADPAATQAWQSYYQSQSHICLFIQKDRPASIAKLLSFLTTIATQLMRAKTNVARSRRSIRIMIVGVPNIGKSTLINLLTRQRKTKVAPFPGVTRQTQWIKLNDHLELLDTPGVMFPRIEAQNTGVKLAVLAVIKEEIVPAEIAGKIVFDHCRLSAPDGIRSVYNLTTPPVDYDAFLAAICQHRGFLMAYSRPDLRRAATALIQDFRCGKLGRITLELPPDQLVEAT